MIILCARVHGVVGLLSINVYLRLSKRSVVPDSSRLVMKNLKVPLLLPLLILLTACGYRAPLYPSYIPQVDSAQSEGIQPGYQELAALMEKDTELKPSQGNTVTLIADGPENWEMLKEEFRKAETSIYVEPYRFKLDTCGRVLADPHSGRLDRLVRDLR